MAKGRIVDPTEYLGRTLNPADFIEYQPGAVVSKTLIQQPSGTITLFAFAQGQGLSEHSAPFNATVVVLDGRAEVRIAGQVHEVGAGEMIIMPANIPHALDAREQFKMLLIMIKS
ncbi:MAG: cupin domain-containing protein [Syntrophomonas sp.]|nr:cupin domain-containing protein [Syntrophomonas sp.]